MFSRHHRKVKLLFALADVALAAIAFWLAYESRALLPLERNFFLSGEARSLLLGFVCLVWPVAGYWLGSYERLDSAQPRVILRDSLKQSAFGIISIILFQFILRLDLSRLFLAMLGSYSWLLLLLFRLNAGWMVGWIRSGFGAPHYVLVVGSGERAKRLGELIMGGARHGIRLAGQMDEERAAQPEALQQYLERQVIDEIIFCVESPRLRELEDTMLFCDEVGVRTRVAVDFFPHVNSDIYLDRLAHLPLLTFSAAPHDEILLFLKRVTDVVLAATALMVMMPMMAGIVLLIRMSSPGPAIFRQTRCGLNGRRFEFYKFRSMVMNAEELKREFQHMNVKQVAFKIPNDPRQTAIGRWLRRFSIDEWPQLWNVLRGDMSLVGPRPAVPEEVERYQLWQRRRLRMRPGLTCLWALEGRDALDFETWMRKDMEYIDNWSLGLDWKIILLTIPRVMSGRGAS
ncbi:MAG TPA: sugar transferase [Bryobacteraceae bacterium]|nr:sugar transferase [Bryobacteraceae bacterium]